MPDTDAVLLEKDYPLARVTLNRPEKLNAMSEHVRDELDRVIGDADEDPGVRVIIIRGSGRAFTAGYDLAPSDDEPRRIRGDRLQDAIYYIRRSGERWLHLLWNMRKPVIAQVHGYCMAGGNDLAGSCDLIIAAEDAVFAQPQARGMGIVHTLGYWPLTIGMRKTRELMYTGDAVTGREAARIGMINKAVPESELEATVEALARRIAIMPTELLASHKQCINRWYETMGLDAMIRATDEFNPIAGRNSMGDQYREIAQKQGLKAALEFRDGPYGGGASNWQGLNTKYATRPDPNGI